MPRRIRILAWIHVVASGALLSGGLMLLGAGLMDRTSSGTALAFIAWLFFWIGSFLLLPSFVGGIGLLWGRRWARVVIIVVSAELLLAIPVGTVLGVFGLWTLLRTESDTVFAAAPRKSSEEAQQQSRLLLVIAAVGIGFAILLGVGSLIFSPSQPVITISGPAGVLLGLAAATVTFLLVKRPKPARRTPAITAQPVALPVLPVACEHVRPIELAMRAAGIEIRSDPYAGLRATCRIHFPSLSRQFAPLEPVTYSEFFQPERYFEDNPTARLSCRSCSSHIETLHPLECSTRTPWFPESPAPPILVADRSVAGRVAVTAVAISPGGGLVAVASGAHRDIPELSVWEAQDDGPARRFALPFVTRAMAWSHDGRMLIAARGTPWPDGPGSPGPCLVALDPRTGAELSRFGGGLFAVRSIALSPDGDRLLVSSMLGETRAAGSALDLWDVPSGLLLRRVAQIEGAAQGPVPYFTGVSFTPDGSRMVAGFANDRGGGGIRVWRAADRQELDLIRHTRAVTMVAVTRDGLRLFAAGDRFGMWSLTDGAKLWDKRSFIDNVAAAAPDGRTVALGTGRRQDNHGPYLDTAVELYDGATGEFLSVAELRTTPSALSFVTDDSFVTGEIEGEVRLWKWSRPGGPAPIRQIQ